MGIQKYVAALSTDGGATYTNLAGLQDVSVMIGKQRQLDAISASRMTLRFHSPDYFNSPITGLVPGNVIRLQNETGTPYKLVNMNIYSVDVEYGIPYAGNKGAQDYVIVTCEGKFAQAGRAEANSVALASKELGAQLQDAETSSGLGFVDVGYTTNYTVQATTVNGPWSNYVTKAINTINGRMWDSVDPVNIYVVGLSPTAPSSVNFSDTANNSTNQVYERVDFSGWGDNYFTRVQVTPDGLATQTATKSGATAPYRVLALDTLNVSTTQALDLAQYLLTTYQTPANGITSVTCKAEAQTSFQLDKFAFGAYGFGSAPGVQVSVTFRGSTVNCVIEGVQMNATPAGSRFTFYLSPAAYNNVFILDNAVFGKLDNNRLGY